METAMYKMINWRKKVTRSVFCAAIGAITLSSCDVLQKDSVQNQDQVKITNNEIYITPKSSGIIDLQSMVQTYGSVKLSVSGQPKNGTLDPFNKDLLKYTPKAGFSAGKDGFAISVYSSSNDFIKTDSVRIIVKPDSVGLPCGLWAMNDFQNGQSTVEIDVLSNDVLCPADRSTIILTLSSASGESNTLQTSYGTVEILASKKIRYTPGNNFGGGDHFTYRIVKPENVPNQGDAVMSSYGLVYLAGTPGCRDSLNLVNDEYNYIFSNVVVTDTIRISPTSNDLICTLLTSVTPLTISQQPLGKIFFDPRPPYKVRYLLPAGVSAGFKDTFKYSICVDNVCKDAEVKLNFN